jgi:hypothetical protein
MNWRHDVVRSGRGGVVHAFRYPKLIAEKRTMRPRQFSICELVWLMIAAATFLGITRTLRDPNGELMCQVCWVLSVVVLRLFCGSLMALLLSAACGGALYGIQACFFLVENPRFGPFAREVIQDVEIGIVFGSALGAVALVAGWLIHQVAQITISIRIPKANKKEQDR